jgi:hypothetical protein
MEIGNTRSACLGCALVDLDNPWPRDVELRAARSLVVFDPPDSC